MLYVSFVMLSFISCCVYVCSVRMSKLRCYTSGKKLVCSAGARNLLETCTQSDTKLCEQVVFLFFFCLFYIKKNTRNIMNCIVPVQAFPGSLFRLFTRYDQVIGRE